MPKDLVLKATDAIQGQKRLCGAQLRGKPGCFCQKPPIAGRERCRLHGGTQPRGVNHPSFKDGRFSRDLPSHLAGRYEEAKADTELLNLHDTIAAAEARTGELFAKLQENVGILDALEQASDNLMCLSNDADKADEIKEALTELERLIKQMNTLDRGQWREIRATMETRRRLTETEAKRQIQMKMFVRMDEAEVFVAAVLTSVRAHVIDMNALEAIRNDIERLMHGNNPPAQQALLEG